MEWRHIPLSYATAVLEKRLCNVRWTNGNNAIFSIVAEYLQELFVLAKPYKAKWAKCCCNAYTCVSES